jgi:hypothetical protein
MTSSNNALKSAVNEFFNSAIPIEWYLPVKLKNGSEVHEISCKCLGCGHSVKESNLKGSIHPSLKGYKITAFGLCEACNLMTPYMYDIVAVGDGFNLSHHKWKGWETGEVIKVDFTKKKK